MTLAIRCTLSAASLMVVAFSDYRAAAQSDPTAERVQLIRDTANDICQTPPLEQTSSGSKLTGEASAKVNGIIGRFVDLGISGAAEYQNQQNYGVLQKDLVNAIKNGNDCRLEVLKVLSAKLLGPPQGGSSGSGSGTSSQPAPSVAGIALGSS